MLARASSVHHVLDTMEETDLKKALEAWLSQERPHPEWLAGAVAYISEAFRRRGLEAVLVGGAAIELHAPGTHVTGDADLVVEGASRADLREVFESLGFRKRDRHWLREELFVEVPSTVLSEPTESIRLGSLTLRVIRKEVVLAERITGFKWWRVPAYGMQAIDMIAAFGPELDEDYLRERLRQEGAEDAFDLLKSYAEGSADFTAADLERDLERMLSRRGEKGEDP